MTSQALVVLPAVLDPTECAALARAVDGLALPRVTGRQGTGYDKVDLLQVDDPVVVAALERLRALLGAPPAWDAWWLEYPPGSHIPPHTDPSPADGLAHVRVNVVVERAPVAPGGQLVADGRPVHLEPGDAVVFRPDVVEHAVTPVAGAPRRVVSVGTVLPPDAVMQLLAELSGALRR